MNGIAVVAKRRRAALVRMLNMAPGEYGETPKSIKSRESAVMGPPFPEAGARLPSRVPGRGEDAECRARVIVVARLRLHLSYVESPLNVPGQVVNGLGDSWAR